MHMKLFKSWLLTGSAVWLCAGAAASVQAQTAPANQTANAAPASVEEIIVTASKRPERALDVAGAISAYKASDLLQSGATSIKDLVGITPGLSFNSITGTGSPIVRGITIGVDTSPTVGIVVNGAPIGPASSLNFGADNSLDLDPIDLDHVEVLKGPQGTLYGANTLAGLISYTLREPSLSTAQAIVRGEVDDTEHGEASYSIRGAVSGPIITDQLGLGLSAYYTRPGGFIGNSLRDLKDENYSNNWGVHGALLFEPLNKLRISVDGFYQHTDINATDVVLYNIATKQPVNGDLNYDQYLFPHEKKNISAVVANINYDLGFASLTSVTSYSHLNALDSENATGDVLTSTLADVLPLFGGPAFPTPNLLELDRPLSSDRTTEELRLTSPADRRFSWIVGGFYSYENNNYAAAASGRETTGAPVPTLDPALDFNIFSTLEEYSGFADATFKIVPDLDLTGGIRIGRIDQTSYQLFSGSDALALNTLLFLTGAEPVPARSATSDESATVRTYLATLKYHFSRDGIIFARYSTGFRPGGPNVIAPGLPANFKPDTTTNYEVGLKSLFWNGKGSIDVTGYYENWDDIISVISAGGLAGYTNGGDARVYGVESALNLRPIPQLTLSATFSYSQGKITSANAAAATSLAVGDPLPYNPTASGSVSAQYRAPVFADWDGYGSVVARFSGSRWNAFRSVETSPAYLMPAYGLVDIHAGLENSRYSVDLFLKNLTDERAQLSANTAYSIGEVTVARPRTVGVALTAKF